MSRFSLLCIALPIILFLGCSTPGRDHTPASTTRIDHPQPTKDEQAAWLAHAQMKEKQGWIYLHVEGGARERGFQHGYLLATKIKESLRTTRATWEYESGVAWDTLVKQAITMFVPNIDTEDLDELRGITEGYEAAGDSSSVEEMIAYNGIIELQSYWWPEQKKKLDVASPDPRKDGCSSFIATGSMTKDGTIVLGHNTMTDYVGADCYVIIDIVPEKGHRMLMQTSPGWIHSGTDFFITNAGLVGSETTIGDFKGFDEQGIPEFVRMRRAAQDASTIDEWCEIMKKGNNGGYANAWLIGDVNTNEIARLELGLKYVGMERTKDGYFVGSNVAENTKILRLETEEHETDIRQSSVARRVRWKQLMQQYKGKITAELAQQFEADHYDPYLHKAALGWRNLCAHGDEDSLDTQLPFEPGGTVDAKVVDARMAKAMSFDARWGSGCGKAFDAKAFLERHPQFDWQEGLLKSRASHPWVQFTAGER
ncbi:MAG TPA: C45 family peptidase [Bacteroidota bacterium]|nr:C45 family peptidase [Bacteroidota bacterium]